MENTLSSKEIDTLVDALEAWEKKDFGSKIMGSLLKGMLTKDDPVAKAKYEEEERVENEKEEREQRIRKETALMLKAKLVMMKQENLITQLTQ
jgi:hypothetical protein